MLIRNPVTMFLQKLSNRLLSTIPVVSVNALRTLNIVFGKSENELIEKWKQKFAEENISEVDVSIKHILDHVVQKDKVKNTTLHIFIFILRN